MNLQYVINKLIHVQEQAESYPRRGKWKQIENDDSAQKMSGQAWNTQQFLHFADWRWKFQLTYTKTFHLNKKIDSKDSWVGVILRPPLFVGEKDLHQNLKTIFRISIKSNPETLCLVFEPAILELFIFSCFEGTYESKNVFIEVLEINLKICRTYSELNNLE